MGVRTILQLKRIIHLTMISLFLVILVLPASLPQNPNYTPDLYNKSLNTPWFEQNLTKLEPGDIAFKHPDVFPDFFPTIIDHCLLFVKFDNQTGLYVFIEAGMASDQVRYRNETESALLGPFYGPFAKVRHANITQKQNAIDFAKTQLGKPFQGDWINKNYNPEDTKNDSYADEWYCSELIWAAYYNCNHPFPKEKPTEGYCYGEGIDLDRNGWNKNPLNYSIVAPREILHNIRQIERYYLTNYSNGSLDIWDNFFSLIPLDNIFDSFPIFYIRLFDNLLSELIVTKI
jgi:hypothetical protein